MAEEEATTAPAAKKKKAASKAAPKAPQDHKPKAEPDKPFLPEETEGWHLLKTLDEIPAWDQADLLATIHEFMDEFGAGTGGDGVVELSNTPDSLRAIGKVSRAMVGISHNPGEFTQFCTGTEGLTRATNLAFTWLHYMGESKASAS